MITVKVELLKLTYRGAVVKMRSQLTLTEDKDFKECSSATSINVTVAEREVLDRLVDCEPLREHLHALAAKVIVIQLQDFKARVRPWMYQVANELTAERCQLVIQKVKLEDSLDVL